VDYWHTCNRSIDDITDNCLARRRTVHSDSLLHWKKFHSILESLKTELQDVPLLLVA